MDAEYTEELTRKCIWYLKSPAPYGEVVKAVTVARHKYTQMTGESAEWDTIPMIASHDEHVRIWFEVEEKP